MASSTAAEPTAHHRAALLLQSAADKAEAATAILLDSRCAPRDAAIMLQLALRHLQEGLALKRGGGELPALLGGLLGERERSRLLAAAAPLNTFPGSDALDGTAPPRRQLQDCAYLVQRAARRALPGNTRFWHTPSGFRLLQGAIAVLVVGLGGVVTTVALQHQPTRFGWRGEYFSNINLKGPGTVRVDPRISFYWDNGPPMPGMPTDNFTARWDGCLRVEKAGVARFVFGTDDGARVFVNGNKIAESWKPRALSWTEAKVRLEPGIHHVRLEYLERAVTASAILKFAWDLDEPRVMEAHQIILPSEPMDDREPCKDLL